MNKLPVIAIFDVGKTNKKILLFDEQYKLVFEESKKFTEITDEDGFPCEDVSALTQWVKDSFDAIKKDKRFDIKAVNFSAYGAGFVFLNNSLNVCLPLYNYLKPYPVQLKEKFYTDYGGESLVARQTGSPVLGNLNSGMQLYRLKYEKPEEYNDIKYALHLPQYISFILTRKISSDITSIGCHTNLWDFQNNKYHRWVSEEGIDLKLAPIINSDTISAAINESIPAGIGLHDSSAALIPYLISFEEPFILLSTGTWCITLNPFNDIPLSDYELQQDCLSYLSYQGKPVKASRLFAGYEHELQIKRLAEHYNKPEDYYKSIQCDFKILQKIKSIQIGADKMQNAAILQQSAFGERDLKSFACYEEAYHQLINDIVAQQTRSTNLVLKARPDDSVGRGTGVKRIFVDGGFSNNPIYMNLLAEAFPAMEVYAATVPQASALGAALAIHLHWNTKSLPADIIKLKYNTAKRESVKY